MLGCVAESTLTACLTAASVCYEHGPVSTPLSSRSLRPPHVYASLSLLSYLHHSLHAYLTLALPSSLILPLYSVKHNQILPFFKKIYIYLAVIWLHIFSLLFLFLTCVPSYSTFLSAPLFPPYFTGSLHRCWMCFWVFWSKCEAVRWTNYIVKIQPHWLMLFFPLPLLYCNQGTAPLIALLKAVIIQPPLFYVPH